MQSGKLARNEVNDLFTLVLPLGDFLALLLIHDEIIRPSSERKASLRF